MYRQPSLTFFGIYHASAVINSASEHTENIGIADHARISIHRRVIEPVHHVDLEVIALQNQVSGLINLK